MQRLVRTPGGTVGVLLCLVTSQRLRFAAQPNPPPDPMRAAGCALPLAGNRDAAPTLPPCPGSVTPYTHMHAAWHVSDRAASINEAALLL